MSSNCNCICPDIDCSPVLTCINNDLMKVQTGSDPSLDNLCGAVAACVDAQFEAIAAGQSNEFDNFGDSIIKILQSLSGYSDSGDTYLYSSNGVVGWTSVSIGHTYVSSGTGITVTGNGASSTPYLPNLNTTYVKNLFSATNGLTYTTGNTKLGGTLIQDTVVSGNNLYDFSINNLQDFVLESLGDTYLQIASYSGASSGDVLTLADAVNGRVRWSTPASYSGSFINNQYAIAQAASFRISGYGFVGLKFTAGSANQLTDTSHYFKAVSGDTYPIVVHNSASSEIFVLSNSYLKIPDGTTNPTLAFASPYHEGSLYYNTGTKNFVGYHNASWNNLLYDIRNVLTINSITGGGDLTSDRTLSLVNDVLAPGATQYYGTNGAGTKGWYPFTAGSTVTSVGLTAPSIFSVSGSPVTSSGTLALSFTLQSGNKVFAGPATFGFGLPTFRDLVTDDLPDDAVTFDKIQNLTSGRLLGRSTAGSGSVEQLAVGSHLSLVGGTLNAKGRTLIAVTTYTSSTVWIKDSSTNAVLVYVVGGGGGGGGVSGTVAESAAAGGGGGGSYTINYLTTGFGTNETITIGAGGAGGLAGNNNGSSGGVSSFGTLTVVSGGTGGIGMAHGTTTAVSLGGTTGGVSANSGLILGSGGSPGGYGLRISGTVAVSGGSGSSLYNGSASNATTSQIGVSGNAYGVGGSGAITTNGSDFAGGAGLPGFIVVYEFS